MTNACRIGWYESGRVKPFVPGRHKSETPANEPSNPANLRPGPEGIKIVETEINGCLWFGRLSPRKRGLSKGLVLLFRSPTETKSPRVEAE
jgi:hypothetical protein